MSQTRAVVVAVAVLLTISGCTPDDAQTRPSTDRTTTGTNQTAGPDATPAVSLDLGVADDAVTWTPGDGDSAYRVVDDDVEVTTINRDAVCTNDTCSLGFGPDPDERLVRIIATTSARDGTATVPPIAPPEVRAPRNEVQVVRIGDDDIPTVEVIATDSRREAVDLAQGGGRAPERGDRPAGCSTRPTGPRQRPAVVPGPARPRRSRVRPGTPTPGRPRRHSWGAFSAFFPVVEDATLELRSGRCPDDSGWCGSAPATPPPPSEPPADRALLREDGLGPVNFGTASAEALDVLGDLLGDPIEEEASDPICQATGRWLRWEDDLEVTLLERAYDPETSEQLDEPVEVFAGWDVTGASPLTTVEGVGTGTTVRELRGAVPGVEVRPARREDIFDNGFPVDLPSDFEFPPEEEFSIPIDGVLTGATPTGRIRSISSGQGDFCFE